MCLEGGGDAACNLTCSVSVFPLKYLFPPLPPFPLFLSLVYHAREVHGNPLKEIFKVWVMEEF